MSISRILFVMLFISICTNSSMAKSNPSVTTTLAPTPININKTEPQQTNININTASSKELSQIKGVSVLKARAIVSYRKAHGDFKSLEDLKLVKGFKRIDSEMLKEIQSKLMIG